MTDTSALYQEVILDHNRRPRNFSVLALASGPLKLKFAAANAVAILVAMTCTWLGNRYFTFRAQRAHGAAAMAREWLKFLGANAVGAAVNYTLSVLCVRYAPAPFDNKYVAQAIGVLAGLMFNFTLSRRMVFRDRPAPDGL